MIYLVRHGQTEFNRIRRFQGGLDSPLTETGRRQARSVGLLLKTLVDPATPMVASPLGRARTTAEIIREAGGLTGPLVFDDRLREISIGEWDGMTDEEIEFAYPGRRAALSRWEWHFHAPGGETFEAFRDRLAVWLDEQIERDQPLIAVSHGGCSRMLRGLHARLPKEEFLRFEVPQDAIFRLDRQGVRQIDCPADAGA